MNVYLFVLSTLLVAAVPCVLLYVKLAQKDKQRLRQIDQLQNQLQSYFAKVDNLMITLSNIHEFSLKATGLTSREELAQFIVESACKLFNAGNGSVMLINPIPNELEIVASKNLSAEVVSTTRLKIGEGIAGKVAETGKPIFVEDITADLRFFRAPNVQYVSKSFVSVPMESKGKILGVLNISPLKPKETFDEKSLHLLSILADQSAVAFDNIAMYNNLQGFYMEMVEALAKTIDTKDSYTYDHADRARKFARSICKELHLPDGIIKHIEYAALVHDIGKIGIDNGILGKPGKLTPEERKFIEQHPVIGSHIIEPIAFLSPIAPMVLYHQEWYNGGGYPEGLVGEEIPLGARVVSVIDSYDAMTSDRPYRKAMVREQAVAELRRASGTQFDPAIVEAFIKTLEKEK